MNLLIVVLMTLGLAGAVPPEGVDDAEAFLAWVEGAVAAGAVDPRLRTGPVPGRTTPLERPPDTDLARRMAAPGYRFAHQVFEALAREVRERPGRVVPERIGTSLRGRPIWAFHLQDPTGPADRRVLVMAGIHAMEWISTDVALELALELAEHGTPRDVRVTVVPLVNPDGRDKVEEDMLAGELRYRRGNALNIDLNRDFAVNREPRAVWRHLIGGYYRISPAPLSQPESQAIDRLADRERFHRAASLHSFGGFFYTPWSGRFGRPPRRDVRDFWRLGRAMEHAFGRRAYHTRQLGRWGFFFRAHGSEIDHLYGRYGTRAFLIEITRSGMRPFRPGSWKWAFRTYNPADERRWRRHVGGTVRSLQALVRHPELPGERAAREAGIRGLAPPIEGDEAP